MGHLVHFYKNELNGLEMVFRWCEMLKRMKNYFLLLCWAGGQWVQFWNCWNFTSFCVGFVKSRVLVHEIFSWVHISCLSRGENAGISWFLWNFEWVLCLRLQTEMITPNFMPFCYWKSLNFEKRILENTCIKCNFNGQFYSVPQATGCVWTSTSLGFC